MPKRIAVLLLLIFCILTVKLVHARPYHGEIFTFHQPDGQEFQVRLFGDEYFAIIESLESYTLTKDISTGFYCYAQLASDRMAFISTGVKVGEPLPLGLKLKKNSRLSRKAVKQKSNSARKKFGVDSKGRLLPAQRMRMRPKDFGHPRWSPAVEEEAQTLETQPAPPSNETVQSYDTQSSPTIQPAPPSDTTTETRIGLILLAQFPDRPEDATISEGQVDAFANDPSYEEFSNATSVYGYFNIQSNGKLQYNCIVTSYFTAAKNRDYYTDSTISHGVRAKELINEGLAVLKAKDFDFTKIDDNNDAVLDGVNLFYAGSVVNNWAEGLWPHKANSSWDALTGEGFSPDFQYQVTNMGSELALGTFCHENGHMLCNFPDLYAYDENAAEVGSYSLMSNSGSKHPVSIDPYLKIHAGWSSVIELTDASHLRGVVEVDNNTFYRYRNPADPSEYFLLSLRTNSGYEGVYGGSSSAVNPTDGLVVFHAYESGSNTYSSIFTEDSGTEDIDYNKPYELMVVEANPGSSTTPWYDDPAPGRNDAFHSADVSEASDNTVPALKFWDTGSGRTTASGMHIHSVSGQDGVATFTVGEGAVSSTPRMLLTSNAFDSSCDYGTDCTSQTFAILNSGGGSFTYSISDNASWLSVNQTVGSVSTEADQVTISYSTETLSSGTYNTNIIVEAMDQWTTLPVSLTIHPQPVITSTSVTLSKTLLSGAQGTETLTLSNSGGGTLRYSLSPSAPWLQLSSYYGTINLEEDEIAVTFDASDLLAGSYSSTIMVNSPNAGNVPLPMTIHTNLNVVDIAIMSPNGGEILWPGNQHEIRWQTSGAVSGNVRIDLYKGKSLLGALAASTPNSGIFHWDIPAEIPIASDYAIKITSINEPLISKKSGAKFSAAAIPALLSIPYSESFESDFGGWFQSSENDLDWARLSGATFSSGTGPTSAVDGSYYIYTEASSPNFPKKTAILEAYFDLRGATAPLMYFVRHMFGDSMGTLEIRASSDQSHWTTLYNESGDQEDVWGGLYVDLSSLAGNAVTVQLVGITGDNHTSDMALDDLRITETTRVLSYANETFTESSLNDGSIGKAISMSLSGDSFTADAVSGGNVTLSNLPDGLTARFIKTSSTNITFSLVGNAESHAKIDSIQDLIVQFATGAFVGGIAIKVANSTKRMNVNFVGVTKPDLIVTGRTSDTVMAPGAAFQIDATVINQGTAPANATTLTYYLSDDTIIDSSDSVLATDFVDLIPAEGTSLEQVWVTAPSTVGTYWVGACVAAVPYESDTENQCGDIGWITTFQPDLVVINPGVANNILTPGGPLEIFATVKNQGTGTADSSRLTYRLSDDESIDTSDFLYSSVATIDQLSAGATSEEKHYWSNAPSTTGTYWVGGCVGIVDDESNTDNQCSTGVKITVADNPGDYNNDGQTDLKDGILVLQILTEHSLSEAVYNSSDINNDGEIGLPEVIYILQYLSN